MTDIVSKRVVRNKEREIKIHYSVSPCLTIIDFGLLTERER